MNDVTLIPYCNHAPKLASDVFLASGVRVIGDVHLDQGVNVWFNTTIRGDVNYIRVGARTNIQDGSVVHVSSKKYPTIIGREVTIGHNATIHACTIEDQCLIGMGAVILDGAVIGKESLVAAGAVVPPGRKYPAHSLIVGSPAVVKRQLSDAEVKFLYESAENYVRLAEEFFEQTV